MLTIYVVVNLGHDLSMVKYWRDNRPRYFMLFICNAFVDQFERTDYLNHNDAVYRDL